MLLIRVPIRSQSPQQISSGSRPSIVRNGSGTRSTIRAQPGGISVGVGKSYFVVDFERPRNAALNVGFRQSGADQAPMQAGAPRVLERAETRAAASRTIPDSAESNSRDCPTARRAKSTRVVILAGDAGDAVQGHAHVVASRAPDYLRSERSRASAGESCRHDPHSSSITGDDELGPYPKLGTSAIQGGPCASRWQVLQHQHRFPMARDCRGARTMRSM